MDMNMVIANNILTLLEKKNIRQVELADALHTNKQTINKMFNGTSMINANELRLIADYLGVKIEELTMIGKESYDNNIVHTLIGKVNSEQAKEAIVIVLD